MLYPCDWTMDEEGFILNRPIEGISWKNYLTNKDYGLCLDQFASGYAVALKRKVDAGRCYVSHHGGGLADKGRYVYIRESDDTVWNPSFAPARVTLDSYSCRHGFGGISYRGMRGGLEALSRHTLPEQGRFELWSVRLRNRTKQPRRVVLYVQLEFLLRSGWAVDMPYYSWYTDSRFDPARSILEVFSRKPAEQSMLGWFRALRRPSGFEAGLISFLGFAHQRRPAALDAPAATNTPSAGDPPIAAFRYDLELAPDTEWTADFQAGEGRKALTDAETRIPSPDDAGVLLDRASVTRRGELSPQGIYGAIRNSASMHPCPGSRLLTDAETLAWFDTWLPYQVRQQSQGMIRFEYRGYRDVAQDAIGLCHYDLAGARRLILDLAGMQHTDGRCLRQENTLGGPHDERDFRDLPFWLILALARFIRAGGDRAVLDEAVPYLEGETASLLDHVARGLRYVLRFGPHDLLEIGVGDWNDALSDLGPKGESLWLNQIAYLCLNCLEELVTDPEKLATVDLDLDSLRERLYAGVLSGWTGHWFLRGWTESGRAIGGDERIFLLPQAWFTISGMAYREASMAKTALDSMVQYLDHPDGLLKCHPPFTAFDPDIGNLSALTPGMAENYAVYNHAAAFGVDALFLAGRPAEAEGYLERILPFRKDPARTRTEPYVLANYYNGGHYPSHAGRGGISWLTGTANWLVMILFDFLLPPQGLPPAHGNFSTRELVWSKEQSESSLYE